MTQFRDTAKGSGNIDFRFDGKPLVGKPGGSLAAALTANGFSHFRKTVQGADRSIFCGMAG